MERNNNQLATQVSIEGNGHIGTEGVVGAEPLCASVVLVDEDGYEGVYAGVARGEDEERLLRNSWNLVAERVALSKQSNRVLRKPEDYVINWPGDPPVPRRPAEERYRVSG